jgi:hypothetical protein
MELVIAYSIISNPSDIGDRNHPVEKKHRIE